MNQEQNKHWAVLYCPRHEFLFRKKRWEKIEKALRDRNIEFDKVQSENPNSVERLCNMLINNGYKTIIIVGGDSALNDAVNCLMQIDSEERADIVLGVIPNGVMNDFARYWEFNADNVEQTVDWLQKRRVRKIDLGCIRYTNKEGERCRRYFLNCVNIGLVASLMNMRRQTRRLFGLRTLSFLSSLVMMIFHRMDYKMNLKINSEEVKRRVMTLCVGSARGYGQTPNAVPYNGLLDVSLVYQPKLTQLVEGFWLLVTNKFLNHRSVHPYRTREVEVRQTAHAPVNVDGRLLGTPQGGFRITVEQEVINFLIPE